MRKLLAIAFLLVYTAANAAWIYPGSGGSSSTVITNIFNALNLWTNSTYSSAFGAARALIPVDSTRTVSVVVTNNNNQAGNFVLNDTNATHTFTIGNYAENVSTQSQAGALYYQFGQYGAINESGANNGAMRVGDSIGSYGVADGHFGLQIGSAGFAPAQFNSQTNVGVAGSVMDNGKTGAVLFGGYFETIGGTPSGSSNPKFDQAEKGAGILVDTRDSSLPGFIMQTNGDKAARVFSLNPFGDPVIPNGAGLGKFLTDADGVGTARWSPAGITNTILNVVSNNNGVLGIGRSNYYAIWNPNTNTLSYGMIFSTNGTKSVGIKNGDAPDGSAQVDLNLFGHYATESTWDSLSMLWSVAFGDYEIMTKQASSGSARQLTFGVGGTRYWDISTAGHLLPITSGTTDIGAGSDGIRNLWVTGGRVLFDNTGVAGIGQIGYAGSPGSAINFQGQRIGFVDTFNAVDIVRIETGSITPPSKTIVDIGACIIGAGSATGSRNSWFGQDPFNTGNRWVFGTNNTTQAQPAANQIMGSAASGNHSWGGDVQVIGGLSTGSGTNGSVILGTAEGGSAISTQNTPKIRTYIAPEPVTLTESTATLICTVSNITAAHFATVMVVASTFASDGTDHQSVGESFIVSCVNKGGTLTTTVSASSPMSTTTSAGTLTTAYTAVANANGFDLKNNAVSSLTQTKLNTRWRIESIDSDTTPFIFDSAGKHQ